MTVSAVFYKHSIILPDASAITQLTELSLPMNQQDLAEVSAGDTSPIWAGIDEANPEFSFGSTNIKQVIDALGTEKIAADLSAGNTDIYWRKGKVLNLREANAALAHLRVRMASNAMLYWTAISAQKGQNATIRGMIVPIFDGSTDPIQFASNVALVGTPAVDYVFRNGPIYLNGTKYSTLGLDLASNPEVVRETADGEGLLSHVSVDNYSPQLTFRTRDVSVVSSIGLRGIPLTSASIYLRRRSKGGMNVSEATAEHIKATGTAGKITAREIGSDPPTAEVFVQFTKPNATTEPLTWSTSSAITT